MTDRSKLLDTIANGAYWGAGVTFQRSNAVPLEKYSIFESIAKAQEYALLNPVAYPGQPIAVVDDTNNVKFYLVSTASVEVANNKELTEEEKIAALTPEQRAAALIEVSTSADVAGEAGRVDEIIEEINKNIGVIQAALDQAEEDIDALEESATDLEERATDLEERATDLEERATDLEERAGGFDTKIANLKIADENLAKAIETAKQEAIAHANGLQHFSTTVVTSEDDMTQENVLYLVKTEADGRDMYLEYLVMEVEGVKKPVCIGDTTTDLDNYYTISGANTAIATAVNTAKEELQNQISGLSSTHNTDKNALTTAINNVATDLATEVTNRTNADTALDVKIATNTADIAENAEAIEDLTAVVAGNESDIEDKMTAVNTRVDNAVRTMSGIQDQINALDSTYATNDELAAVQIELQSTINTEVETINTALNNRYTKNEVYTKSQTDDKITEVIQGLDKTDTAVATQFVTAVSQADGKISISRAQPSHSDISGFDTQVAAVAKPLVDMEKERALGIEGGLASRISDLEKTVPATYATKDALNGVDTAQKATAAELTKYKTDNDAAVASASRAIEDLSAKHTRELNELETSIETAYLKKTLKINDVEYDATNNKYTITPESIGADPKDSAATAKNEAIAAAQTYTNTKVEEVSTALNNHKSAAEAAYVPKTLKVNDKPLSGNISLDYTDVNADQAGTAATKANKAFEDAKTYTDTREVAIKELYQAADAALGNRIAAIENDTLVKYNTTVEYILDCGNAAGEHTPITTSTT